jgi:hypothetical protein
VSSVVSSFSLPANTPEYFAVTPGAGAELHQHEHVYGLCLSDGDDLSGAGCTQLRGAFGPDDRTAKSPLLTQVRLSAAFTLRANMAVADSVLKNSCTSGCAPNAAHVQEKYEKVWSCSQAERPTLLASFAVIAMTCRMGGNVPTI